MMITTIKDEIYLKQLRESLSSHILGSLGDYSVYLKRWTRMGQTRNDESLKKLLLLGEPEALVAVVHAEDLSSELASDAWWVEPSSENARCMLELQAIADSDMGQVLADFLVEFLPFEEQSRDVIYSVRLVLYKDLISDATQRELWNKGKKKNMYFVGFLLAIPDHLPMEAQPHPDFLTVKDCSDNTQELGLEAQYLLKLMSASGQKFLYTVAEVLRKPANQSTMICLFQAIQHYFAELSVTPKSYREIGQLTADSKTLCLDVEDNLLTTGLSQYRDQREAMFAVAMINVSLLDPIWLDRYNR